MLANPWAHMAAAWSSHCQGSPSASHLPVSSFDFCRNQFQNSSTLKNFKGEALNSNLLTHREERSNSNGVSGTRLVRVKRGVRVRDASREDGKSEVVAEGAMGSPGTSWPGAWAWGWFEVWLGQGRSPIQVASCVVHSSDFRARQSELESSSAS